MHTTLATKLFDYMALGLPVLASDVRPMRRVPEETGAAVAFRPGDLSDLAAQRRARDVSLGAGRRTAAGIG